MTRLRHRIRFIGALAGLACCVHSGAAKTPAGKHYPLGLESALEAAEDQRAHLDADVERLLTKEQIAQFRRNVDARSKRGK